MSTGESLLNPILIVEDDLKTSQLIENYLHKEFFDSIVAFNGPDALELFSRLNPCLLILDAMIPVMDGYKVCSEIRKSSSVPILFLTARTEESDRVRGLELGGDDYVAKPFSPRELVARVKSLLRRAQTAQTTPALKQETIGLRHDSEKRRFSLNGISLSLTPIEFTLLKSLMSHPGKVFQRDELLDKLYPDGELVIDRVIDVHIGKLRQKIGDDPNAPTYIHTVRGIGYRFSDEV